MRNAPSMLGLAVASLLLAGCGGCSRPAVVPMAPVEAQSTNMQAAQAPTASPSRGGPAPSPTDPASTSTAAADPAAPAPGAAAGPVANPTGAFNASTPPSGGNGQALGSAPPGRIADINGLVSVPVPPAVPGGPDFDAAKATATVKVTISVVNPPKQKPIPMAGDPACSGLHTGPVAEETVVAKDGKLANVIVYVSKGAEKWSYKTPAEAVMIDQKGCMYVPHVLTFMVGQPVNIRNSDAFSHNVHAMPKFADEEFNSSQLAGAPILTRKFTKTEVGMKIKCDIHTWMGALAGVFDHPFHGVTAPDGTCSLKLPPGDYEISVWHEYGKFGKVAPQAVTVKDGEAKELAFTFEKPK